MCRNITELRGLEPPATQEEIEAAAYQFVRKITGVTKPTGATAEDMRAVVARDRVTSRTICSSGSLPAGNLRRPCRRCAARRCGPAWASNRSRREHVVR